MVLALKDIRKNFRNKNMVIYQEKCRQIQLSLELTILIIKN